MKHPERNNRKNPWTHHEDALLYEAMEHTKSKNFRCWRFLLDMGVNRTYKAVTNRIQYLGIKNAKVKTEVSLPKGWGVY